MPSWRQAVNFSPLHPLPPHLPLHFHPSSMAYRGGGPGGRGDPGDPTSGRGGRTRRAGSRDGGPAGRSDSGDHLPTSGRSGLTRRAGPRGGRSSSSARRPPASTPLLLRAQYEAVLMASPNQPAHGATPAERLPIAPPYSAPSASRPHQRQHGASTQAFESVPAYSAPPVEHLPSASSSLASAAPRPHQRQQGASIQDFESASASSPASAASLSETALPQPAAAAAAATTPPEDAAASDAVDAPNVDLLALFSKGSLNAESKSRTMNRKNNLAELCPEFNIIISLGGNFSGQPLSDRDSVKIKKSLGVNLVETGYQQDQMRRYKTMGITTIPMNQQICPIVEQGTRKISVACSWDACNYTLRFGCGPCLQASSDSCPVYLLMEVSLNTESKSRTMNWKNNLAELCPEFNIIISLGGNFSGQPLLDKDSVKIKKSLGVDLVETGYQQDQMRRYKTMGITTIPMNQQICPIDEQGTRKISVACSWDACNYTLRFGCGPCLQASSDSCPVYLLMEQKLISSWTSSNFSSMPLKEVQKLCMDLIHMCNATGMIVNPCLFVELKSDNPNHRETAWRDMHRFRVDGKGIGRIVMLYLWDECNYGLKHGSWPCLQAGSYSRRFNLPMEVCKIAEGQMYSKKQNDIQLAKILRANCKHPLEKEVRIGDMVVGSKDAENRFAQELVSSHKMHLLKMASGGTRNRWTCLNSCFFPEEIIVGGATLDNNENVVKDESAQNTVISSGSTVLNNVHVNILGNRVKVNIPPSCSVDVAVHHAMNEVKIWVSDFYVRTPHRLVPMDSTVGNFPELIITPRLRGGSGGASSSELEKISLDSWIIKLQNEEDSKWFEIIDVPDYLRRAEHSQSWLIVLGPEARLVLCLILDLLERVHLHEFCYDGQFNLSDIYFIPMYGILVMDDRIQKKILNHDGYKADLQTVVTKALDVHFKFRKSDGTYHYPAYLGYLVQKIQHLEKKDAHWYSAKRRSLIYNDPTLWSSAKRVHVFSLVNEYFKRLTGIDRNAILKAMWEGPKLHWHSKVDDLNAPQAMRQVFNKKFWNGSQLQKKGYPLNLMGRVDFTRCVIVHATDSQVSLVVVDAAVYMIWPEQLQKVHEFFTVQYNQPSKKRLSNKGKGPAMSTINTKFRVDTLPKKEDLEVFEIFGLPTEPKN